VDLNNPSGGNFASTELQLDSGKLQNFRIQQLGTEDLHKQILNFVVSDRSFYPVKDEQ